MSPRTKADRAEREAVILALLEECPYTTSELARRVCPGMNMMLPAMARAGKVKQCADHRWALPTFDESTLARYPFVDAAYYETKKPKQSRTRFEHERPESRTIKVDTEIAWWVGLDRQRFNDEIASRAGAMQQSKESRHVPFRMLQ